MYDTCHLCRWEMFHPMVGGNAHCLEMAVEKERERRKGENIFVDMVISCIVDTSSSPLLPSFPPLFPSSRRTALNSTLPTTAPRRPHGLSRVRRKKALILSIRDIVRCGEGGWRRYPTDRRIVDVGRTGGDGGKAGERQTR